MEGKPRAKRAKRRGKIEVSKSPVLTDDELEGFVSVLWENIDCLPVHIQNLLHESQEDGAEGAVSYMLAAGWAIGKFEYRTADLWMGGKGGWVPNENLAS